MIDNQAPWLDFGMAPGYTFYTFLVQQRTQAYTFRL